MNGLNRKNSDSNEEERYYELLGNAIHHNSPMGTGYKIAIWANFFTLAIYNRIEQEFALSRSDLFLLVTLNGGAEMTATQISTISGRPKNTISRAVDRMRRAGFIDWRRNKSDARTAFLTITPKGQVLYDQILARFSERQKEMLSPLTGQEQLQLEQLFTKLMAYSYPWTIR